MNILLTIIVMSSLEKYRTHGQDFTHYSPEIIERKGKTIDHGLYSKTYISEVIVIKEELRYYVSEDMLESFYRDYLNDLSKGENLYLKERQLGDNRSILMIHINLGQSRFASKYHHINPNDIYTIQNIKHFIDHYIGLVKKHIIVDEEQLECYILEPEKPLHTVDGINMEGITFIFPHIRLHNGLIDLIRNSMIDRKIDKGNLISRWYNGQVDIMMYGSKDQHTSPYILKKLYRKGKLDKLKPIAEDKLLSLIKKLSIRKKIDSPKMTKEGISMWIDYISEKIQKRKYKVARKNIADIEIFLYSLDKNKVDIISVGCCLKNISIIHGIDLTDLWIRFSKKNPSFNEEECIKIWNGIKPTNKGYYIDTLYYWIKEDRKNECDKIFRGFGWVRVKWIYIGHLKNDVDCFFRWLPYEMIKEIISYCN